MCVILFYTFNGCSGSIKEINRLIWKGMSNLYYRAQLTFPKLWFSRKEILKNALSLKNRKVQGIFGGRFILGLSSSTVFRLQDHVLDDDECLFERWRDFMRVPLEIRFILGTHLTFP